MSKLMDFLEQWFKPIIENRWFELLSGVLLFMNPVALFPATLSAFTTNHPEEIVVSTWLMISFIQMAIGLQGIKMKSQSLFFSMALCQIETVTIAIVALIRR